MIASPLPLLAWLLLSGCVDRAADPGEEPSSPQAATCPDSLAVPDPALRTAIAAAVDPATGDCSARLAALTSLAARGLGIERLEGSGALTGLTQADLGDNAIVDLAPLAGMHALVLLNLEGNLIADASPLARLPALQFLILSFNQIGDVSPLLDAPALRSLELTGNPLDAASVALLADLEAGGVAVEFTPATGDADTSSRDGAAPDRPWPPVPRPVAGIAYLRFQTDRGRPVDSGLFLLDPDLPGRSRRLVSDSLNVLFPSAAWSADGGLIAYVERHAFRGYLTVSRADGEPLTPDGLHGAEVASHANGFSGVTWSPDGARFAFSANWTFDSELYLVDYLGPGQAPAGPTPLAHAPGLDCCPAWSPDGRRIAFTSERGGNPSIYRIAPDGSDLVRLTDAAGADYAPAWSPDGERLAFSSDRDGNSEIYVMNADGSSPRRLTDHPQRDSQPTWSPDGERIAFCSDRDGDFEIYVTDADESGEPVNLSRAEGWDCYPSWSPARPE